MAEVLLTTSSFPRRSLLEVLKCRMLLVAYLIKPIISSLEAQNVMWVHDYQASLETMKVAEIEEKTGGCKLLVSGTIRVSALIIRLFLITRRFKLSVYDENLPARK